MSMFMVKKSSTSKAKTYNSYYFFFLSFTFTPSPTPKCVTSLLLLYHIFYIIDITDRYNKLLLI